MDGLGALLIALVAILFLYGVLPTLQPLAASFGRVYAAYRGLCRALPGLGLVD